MGKTTNEFKGISKRASALLNRQEGLDVDFKQDLKGLENADLVAFANSPYGGTILIGVSEQTAPNGRQTGKVVGSPVGDEAILKITSKANDCYPRIDVQIFVENLEAIPFIRVEIPSGKYKPYATGSGIYKIRGEGRNLALLPDHLLTLFLENESSRFFQRFKEATSDLERGVEEMRTNVSRSLEDILRAFEFIDQKVTESLDEIVGNLGDIDAVAGDTEDVTSTLAQDFEEFENAIDLKLTDHAENINSLLDHFGIETVERKRMKYWLASIIRWKQEEHPTWTKAKLLEELVKESGRLPLTQSELEELYDWASSAHHEGKDDEKDA